MNARSSFIATRWIVALPLALGAVQAPAHPGHPALDAVHTHGPFGADPLYALLALGAVLVSAVLWRIRRRGAIPRRSTPWRG